MSYEKEAIKYNHIKLRPIFALSHIVHSNCVEEVLIYVCMNKYIDI